MFSIWNMLCEGMTNLQNDWLDYWNIQSWPTNYNPNLNNKLKYITNKKVLLSYHFRKYD